MEEEGKHKKVDWENSSNHFIATEMKKMQQRHESLKNKIVEEYDELEEIEKEFEKANKVLTDRLKGRT